jgi:hypothetical protein
VRSIVLLARLAGVAVALAVASCGGATGPLEVTPSPVDFGEVVRPDQATRTVRLENTSGRRLFLGAPVFSCGCFALLDAPPAVLPAGESVELRILLDSTKEDPQRLKKTLTFPTDDRTGPVVVSIVGEIVEWRRWTPSRLDLGVIPAESRLSVRPGEGFRLEPKRAVSSDPRLEPTLVPAQDGGADLVVKVVPGAAPGSVHAQILVTLEVSGRGKPPWSFTDPIWVTGTVK